MSKRFSKEYTIWDAVTPKAVTSSTDATPIVVTKASHGFSAGDLVIIFGHTTNIAANGIFKVGAVTSSTFALTDRYSGASVAGSGAGAGSGGVVAPAPKIIYVEEFRNIIMQYITAGTATLTAKIAGSVGKSAVNASDQNGDTPNFGATQGIANPYTFLQAIDLDDGSTVNGSTGLAASGTDLNKTYEVNVNGLKYLTLIPTAWTQGSITAKVKLFSNE